MPKLSGTWRFNDIITVQCEHFPEQLNFITTMNIAANGVGKVFCNCIGMYHDEALNDGTPGSLGYIVASSTPDLSNLEISYPVPCYVWGNDGTGWGNDGYGESTRSITFTKEQEVSDEFYTWFTEQAKEQAKDDAITIISYKNAPLISLAEGECATLYVKGKTMEDNIHVNVEKIDNSDGSIVPTEGTAIPQGAAVERIYFNTNLTIKETNSYLSQLTYIETPFLEYPLYAIYASTTDGETGSFIIAIKASWGYALSEIRNIVTSEVLEFYNSISSDNAHNNGWYSPWKPDVEGDYVFVNSMTTSSSEGPITEFSGIPIGAENEKIKNVLSITPFVTSGYEAGKQAEHDAFWDAYQQNGNRTNYIACFAGMAWTDELYNPKYDITATFHAGEMFKYAPITNTKVPIVIDNTGYTTSVFQGCTKLVTIPSIKVTEKNQTFSNWFLDCRSLVDIHFTEDSVIAKDISFSVSSVLSTASVNSIINALKDLTGATAQTLTFHADVGAALTDAQKAAITAKNWQLVY